MRLFLRSINIGGWHVSEFLKQFLDWKKEGPELAVRGATTSSLDTAGHISNTNLWEKSETVFVNV
jgi:hypothetical protein